MPDIETEVEAGVMTVTLNRPERMNSLSTELTSGLLDAVNRASKDEDVRVMVLTGAGRAFCAGAEVSPDRMPACPRAATVLRRSRGPGRSG